jgi:hypothetical protein
MGKLMLKRVHIAFPALAEPQAIGEGKPAYGGKLIIDPQDNGGNFVRLIDREIRTVAKEKWKDRAEEILQMLEEDDKVCFKKKPYRSKKTGKVFEGFEGMYHLGTRSETTKPTVIDISGAEVTDKDQIRALIYSGCRVHAEVEFWAQDNQYGRRINCTMNGVMFAAHGQRFGGGAGPSSTTTFAEFAEEPDFGTSDAEDLV